jgi:HlyD family type I secretion membrane fusion protein
MQKLQLLERIKMTKDPKNIGENSVSGTKNEPERKRKSLAERKAERMALKQDVLAKVVAQGNIPVIDVEDISDANASINPQGMNKKEKIKHTAANLIKKINKIKTHKSVVKSKEVFFNKIMHLRNISPMVNRLADFVDILISYMLKKENLKSKSEVMQYTSGPASFGIWVIAAFIFAFIVWGVLAPLNSAAIIDGQLVLESKKRVLQHHSGGIIDRVYVKNGDHVDKGELLISLNKVSMQTRLDNLKSKVMLYQVEHARLLAERQGADKIIYDAEVLKNAGHDEVAKIISTQENLFESRKSAFEGRIKIKEEKIHLYDYKKEALNAQLEAVQKQIDIVSEQITSYTKLVEKGNISKENLKRLEQQIADLLGRKVSFLSEISIATQTMLQEEADIKNEKAAYLAEIQREFKQNQENLNNFKAELLMTEEEFKRLDIVAPTAGSVSNLTPQTEGGILPREQAIMEIVPQDDKLVFDARVKVEDIDVVRVNQTVSIRLAPFKSRVVPPIDGTIIALSPDVIQPRYQGEVPHYSARIEFNKKSLNEVVKVNNIELYPGMPGQGFVEIGTRTLLRYLLDPITMSFRKAFIEQ